MKKRTRSLVAWVLYYVGRSVSVPMLRLHWGWLYPAYNRLMGWSVQVQGGSDGPWRDAR